MKRLIKFIIVSYFLLTVNLLHAFIGGAHGGGAHGGSFGGGAHGSFSTSNYHGSAQSDNSSDPTTTLIQTIAFYGLILFLMGLYLWLSSTVKKTKLQKIFIQYKQKKYIRKCNYTPIKPKFSYSSTNIENAIRALKLKAMEDVKEIDYLSSKSHNQLVQKTLKSFEQLQKAWSARSKTRVTRACHNPKYSSKLCNQIEKMASLDVYNYIDGTVITECHLVKCYRSTSSYVFVLRFIIKGKQIDEYITQKNCTNPEVFNSREFNCLVDVIPYKRLFKIYQIQIDQHTDDYVMKQNRKLSKKLLNQ